MATHVTLARHTLGTKIYVADPANPSTFIQVKECIGLAAVGKTRPLVKVTYSDAQVEAYIGGRADGDEETWRFNWIENDPGQQAVRTYDAAGTNFQMRVLVPSSPQRILGFEVTPLRASDDPSNIDGQQVFEFQCKVNSTIDRNASL